MENGPYLLHTLPDERPVGDRTDMRSRRRRQDVQADDFIAFLPKGAHHRVPQMAGAACNKDFHCQLIVLLCAGIGFQKNNPIPANLQFLAFGQAASSGSRNKSIDFLYPK